MRQWAVCFEMRNATTTLQGIAVIRTGYPFRGRIERAESGGCRLVQMGDVRADPGEFGDTDLGRIEPPPNWEEYRVVEGDVLFVGRGTRNEAAMFVGQGEDVIAAPHLFVLRVRSQSSAASIYLTWYLNLPETRERIRAIRVGSGVPFVPLEAFLRLKAPLPTQELQGRLAGVEWLWRQEAQLMARIKDRRRALIDGVLRAAVLRETGAVAEPTANDKDLRGDGEVEN
jgi:hypothetical protein